MYPHSTVDTTSILYLCVVHIVDTGWVRYVPYSAVDTTSILYVCIVHIVDTGWVRYVPYSAVDTRSVQYVPYSIFRKCANFRSEFVH